MKNHLIKILGILMLTMSLSAFCSRAAQEDNFEERIEDAQRVAAVAPAKGNWVPVPMPISNPTVGTGLQAVLMYLHPKANEDSRSPNATSGLVGMVTNTDSLFKTSQILSILPDISGHIRSAGLGILITFDSRNNNYYPTKGQWFEAKWTNYGKIGAEITSITSLEAF